MVAFNDNHPSASELLASPKTRIVVFFTYPEEPFGDIAAQSGALAGENPFQFSTKYFGEETGLVYYGLRCYNPEMGRWVSRDPIGEDGGIHLYGFVGNNPVAFFDVLGLDWDVKRRGESTADAMCDCGDSVEDLAKEIHLDADQYTLWLKPQSGARMPSSKDEKLGVQMTFSVPNEVHITQGNLDPIYNNRIGVYGKTTAWKNRVKKSYQRWYRRQRYKVVDHWTGQERGWSKGNSLATIQGALGQENIAIWLHFGHGGTEMRDGVLWGGNLSIGRPPVHYGPSTFGSAKHHSLEKVVLYSCGAGIKGKSWAEGLVAPKKYGAVLWASPKLVGSPTWGTRKRAYYNE